MSVPSVPVQSDSSKSSKLVSSILGCPPRLLMRRCEGSYMSTIIVCMQHLNNASNYVDQYSKTNNLDPQPLNNQLPMQSHC